MLSFSDPNSVSKTTQFKQASLETEKWLMSMTKREEPTAKHNLISQAIKEICHHLPTCPLALITDAVFLTQVLKPESKFWDVQNQ